MNQLKASSLSGGKIFIVSRSKVNERYDPYYIFHKLNSSLESKYESERLGSLVQTFSGGTPSKECPDYWDGDIPWVSPKDFGNFELFDSKDTISEEGIKNSSTKIAPEDSILIVVRSGILAHTFPVCINRIPVAINQDLKVLIPKNDSLLPEFLGYYFFTFGRKLLPLITKHGTTVHSINTEQFERLKVPLPPTKVQKQIISIFRKAKQNKKQKEAEAENLLNSIDNYLLSELGIELPEKDNSLKNRIFTTSFQNISGKRYDPKPYDNHSQNLYNAVKNANYPKTKLKKIVVHSVSGKWGKSTDSKIKEEKYQQCLVIRATEFDNLYNLKLENDRAKYRLIKKQYLKKLDIQANDLLIEKSGGSPDQPVGRIALLRKDLIESNTVCFSNFVHKIRVDECQILPEYLFNFLKTIHKIKITEIMQSQTSGIRNLIMSEYFNQDIVIPKKSKQRKIAEEINRRRFKAQELEKKALQEVERARRLVEDMILAD